MNLPAADLGAARHRLSPPPPTISRETCSAERRPRVDGWTPLRQRDFLEAVAAGESVRSACGLVGLSAASAYAFRRTLAGEVFSLGWLAANLLARDALHDRLMTRALDGFEDVVTRTSSETMTRHRHDHRLALVMLTRLEKAAQESGRADLEAARLVAREFDTFLDVIESGAGSAAAADFLANRLDRPSDNPLIRMLLACEAMAAEAQARREAEARASKAAIRAESERESTEAAHRRQLRPLLAGAGPVEPIVPECRETVDTRQLIQLQQAGAGDIEAEPNAMNRAARRASAAKLRGSARR